MCDDREDRVEQGPQSDAEIQARLRSKEYLGDGVYAGKDRFGDVVIYTSNGIEVRNEIYFERDTLRALIGYLDREVLGKYRKAEK